jgi:hypothetical protein
MYRPSGGHKSCLAILNEIEIFRYQLEKVVVVDRGEGRI